MSTTPTLRAQDDELTRIVEAEGPARRPLWARRPIQVGALLAVAAVVFAAARSGRPSESLRWRTEKITRGDLTVSVSATGTLQPTTEVDVGSEVSGLVVSVLVDDNDSVKAGQALARLDVSRLKDQVVNAKAALAAAKARVLQTQATVGENRANLARLQQAAELSNGTITSQADMETAQASVARAVADEASARAAVEQAEAALSSAQINLAKASIRSPIDGIVLAREVEPGQTVAASFQAPVLFTLAENLTQMDLEVDVDEADVGQVRAGQEATFTVDAYPNRKYPAQITRVSYGSQTKDGVVSYKTTLSVRNDDLSLRPGMTATADITTAHLEDVLLVPNAALRFTPPATLTGPRERGGIVSSLLPHPPRSLRSKPSNGQNGAHKIWVLREGQVEPLPVVVGATDGRLTEVRADGLQAGDQVVTDIAENAS
jgi:HlyD family secretion protein